MIRWIRRYGILLALPLIVVTQAMGCRSTGRYGGVDPCSGCGRSHQAKQHDGHASDGHNHAHP